MVDLIPMPQPTSVTNSNGSRASTLLFRVLALIHAPTLAIVGWLALMTISQNKEIALLQQEEVTMAASVEQLYGLVNDRYYRSEAMKDHTQMAARLKEHRRLPWHRVAGQEIIKLRGEMRRMQEDVKDLEKAHVGKAYRQSALSKEE